MGQYRIERDSMGEMRVPADALYGPQTQRAVENFPISGLRFPRLFIRALGLIKGAAAAVNAEIGGLAPDIAAAIETAAGEVAEGAYDSEFVVDIFQTGSGTSTNMNANEVIATLASRRLGSAVHPNDQVNRGQSSNDVIPAAMHIAAAELVRHVLVPALAELEGALKRKSAEFHDAIKIGRTHLQDAVPMRLGQEFAGYARQVEASTERLHAALEGIYELPLGGTALGTGLNAAPGFGAAVIGRIAKSTGLPFREARNHFEAQAAKDAVRSSVALSRLAPSR
jgi:fumarate hydratase class II